MPNIANNFVFVNSGKQYADLLRGFYKFKADKGRNTIMLVDTHFGNFGDIYIVGHKRPEKYFGFYNNNDFSDTISHESLHLAIGKIGELKASNYIDKRQFNHWHDKIMGYCGLGLPSNFYSQADLAQHAAELQAELAELEFNKLIVKGSIG